MCRSTWDECHFFKTKIHPNSHEISNRLITNLLSHHLKLR